MNAILADAQAVVNRTFILSVFAWGTVASNAEWWNSALFNTVDRVTQPKAWAPSTGKFTVPSGFDGLWQLSAGGFSSAPTTCVGFAINGAIPGGGDNFFPYACGATNNAIPLPSITIIRWLNAGDTVVPFVYVSAIATLGYQRECPFWFQALFL